MMSRRLVHIYCGEGKGKTTAALGLGLRAVGRGWRVLLVQFLKATPSGELEAISQLPGFTVWRSESGLSWLRATAAEHAALSAEQDSLLSRALLAARMGTYDLLILDEVLAALGRGLVDRQALLAFLREKPDEVEVVLTGRQADEELLALGDYITEMRKLRHPYDRGIAARSGIER